MGSRQQPLAVSMGEPAGIGIDLALLAWCNRKALKLPPFYVRGDEALFLDRAARLELNLPIVSTTPDQASSLFAKALPIVQTGPALADRPGEEQADTAPSVLSSIESCVEDIHAGHACGLVTCPINKAALYETGFSFPGHTEYLGDLAKRYWPDARVRPVMMIAGPELMVVPVTIHIALKDVPSRLTSDLIVETATIAAEDLKARFGYEDPRLAICGLNPHAGENGAMGTEDRDVIAPAVETLRARGLSVSGPLPADTLFHPEARAHYDCVLGMYHDQVLIPAKTIGFDDSVNVTLGLPFVRTSPDHGTAYALAGTGKIRIDSFAAALRMAAALALPEKY
ncbi:4-hydroxythreonine-4-phosphate dehydrogenase PdxA [Roseibium sp. Sym1]|uniref:4-hydroxythreonine-4-phosphate dehydrogenase PdxA n=1 Tax=Roseibium sp. Sym1 TaxID=3016006 RepID=UPI0022B3F32C|nr:4-hydroxythreonine-4-phosphate dehydrogenase PdxA [Roseibium sp. Sym1]